MIRNFTELKKQLEELSSVVNAFKSEAVQLRIVDLIFKEETGGNEEGSERPVAPLKNVGKRRRKSTRKGTPARSTTESQAPKKTSHGSRMGPAQVLGELVEDGFFKEKRTINDVIEYAASRKARNFKANELSTPLARFVRDKRLNRAKNADGQYEYHKT